MVLSPMSFPVASMACTVVYAFKSCDGFDKLMVVLLLIGSVLAWTLMLTKLREFKQAMDDGRRFLAAYRREANPLVLFSQKRIYSGPLARIYQQVCQAVAGDLVGSNDAPELFAAQLAGNRPLRLNSADFTNACKVSERTLADLGVQLEVNMSSLSILVTAAPFLGLLGTAWGVLDALRLMDPSAEPVLLSAVVPGISGALLPTIVALLVALPSLIGYNLLNRRMQQGRLEMENFSDELTRDLARYFLDANQQEK